MLHKKRLTSKCHIKHLEQNKRKDLSLHHTFNDSININIHDVRRKRPFRCRLAANTLLLMIILFARGRRPSLIINSL